MSDLDVGEVAGTLPWVCTRFVDAAGNITEPWLQFFYLLWRRTGGDGGSSVDAFIKAIFGAETTYASPDQLSFDFPDIPVVSLADIVRDALTIETIAPPPAFPDVPAEIVQALALLSADAVREQLARENVMAQPSRQEALPDMVMPPATLTNAANAPILLTLTGSPVTIYARGRQTLSLDGGMITQITYRRGTWSRILPATTAFIEMSAGETVEVTYMSAPTIYVLQR